MINGVATTALMRRQVADITTEHATLESALASLSKPRNLSETLTYWVLRSLIEDEYEAQS